MKERDFVVLFRAYDHDGGECRRLFSCKAISHGDAWEKCAEKFGDCAVLGIFDADSLFNRIFD